MSYLIADAANPVADLVLWIKDLVLSLGTTGIMFAMLYFAIWYIIQVKQYLRDLHDDQYKRLEMQNERHRQEVKGIVDVVREYNEALLEVSHQLGNISQFLFDFGYRPTRKPDTAKTTDLAVIDKEANI